MFSLLQDATKIAEQIQKTAIEQVDHAAQAGKDVHGELLSHLMPHRIGELGGLSVYNLQIYQLASVATVLLLFGIVAAKLRRGGPLTGLWRVLGGWVLWIRDEVVFPAMGKHHGHVMLPYFLSMFFFIMFCNLFGLLPAPIGGTATASIFVTGVLAMTTLLVVMIMGMKEQGIVSFWVHLVPSGVPGWLVPVMFVVELIGFCAKHIALMLRLFVAMIAGHIIVEIFLGLIFVAGTNLGLFGGLTLSIPLLGVLALVTVIEAFVALLQAYIFTYLSALFIGGAMHPDH